MRLAMDCTTFVSGSANLLVASPSFITSRKDDAIVNSGGLAAGGHGNCRPQKEKRICKRLLAGFSSVFKVAAFWFSDAGYNYTRSAPSIHVHSRSSVESPLPSRPMSKVVLKT